MELHLKAPTLSLADKLWSINWLLVALLCLIGAVGYAVLYSAAGGSPEPWAFRHAVRLAAGLCLMLLLALVDVRVWFKIAYPLFAFGVALLVAVDVMGFAAKGAQRWIDLGPVQLQPSEIMKIALILVLARWFHPAWLDDVRRPLFLVVPLLMVAVPVALVMVQPDLGTAITLITLGGTLFFATGVRWWKFALVIALVLAVLPVGWEMMHDYQRQRVLTFLDPENDPLGAGYHIIQSKIALGSGGFWGKGYLHGSQAQLNYLPEKHTDFAFTTLAEETGFVGATATLALFLGVVLMGIHAATRARSQFARLVIIGLSMNFAVYAVINTAMVMGLIPVVGIPLPMISYGGTVMLTVLIGFGILLSADVHRDMPILRYPRR
ncbi:rod shape-determining protein RodA [Geminicoccus harenae]|uniref:rod shape-determining protein RodA n=1 Tax=Geminicoccus harenae TaxID=2498453 RepID=UPI00168B27BD|nr:rod shape-determining protein RodA [Geminicoccus harenae]